MKWRGSLIVVTLVMISVMLINWRSRDQAVGASQVSSVEPQPSSAGMTSLSENLVIQNSDLPIDPLLSGTPPADQGRIRNNPEVARVVEQRFTRSHEIEMTDVRRALDVLGVDQAIRENILEEIALSQEALIRAKMAEARGDIALQEYVDSLSTLSPSAIASRYFTTPKLVEFNNIVQLSLLRQDGVKARYLAAELADLYSQMGITSPRTE